MNRFYKVGVLIIGYTILMTTVSYGVIVNGIACKVNDSIITIHEFKKAYESAVRRSKIFGTKKPTKKQVLDNLIERLLIKEEADKRGIVVTDKEIDEIISKLKKDNNLTDEGFKKELKKEGLTLEELRDNYRINILRERLISQMVMDSGYEVSEEEIKDFYNNPENKRFFSLPAVVKLSEIFIKVPSDLDFKGQMELKNKVKEIYEKAKNGEDFNSLINKYSEDPNKKYNKGHIGSFNKRQLLMWLPPEDVELIFSYKKGDIVPPIRTRDGYFIFRIDDKTENRILSLQEAHDQIKSFLLKKKGNEIFEKWLAEKKKNSFIQCFVEME